MSSPVKLIKNTGIYVILGFLPLAVNSLLAPIYTEYLSPEEYGIIGLATIVQNVLVNLIALGLAGAYSRFYFDFANDKKQLYSLLKGIFIAIILQGLLFVMLLEQTGALLFEFSFKNELLTYNEYGIYINLIAIGTIIQSVILVHYRNEEKPMHFAIYSMIFFISMVGGVLYEVVYLKNGALGSVSGRAYGIVIPTCIYLLFFFIKYGVKVSWKELWPMYKYGLPLIPYMLLALAFNNLDRIIIERFLSMSMLGIYTFGLAAAAVISIFQNGLQSATFPQVYRQLKEENFDKSRLILESFLVGGLLVIAISLVFSEPLILYLIDSQYHSVVKYLPLLILSYVFRSNYIVFSLPLFYYHKTKVLPIINLLSFGFGLVTTIWLANLFGLFGVAIGVVFVKAYQLLFALIFVKRYKLYNTSLFRLNSIHILTLTYLVISLIVTYYRTSLSLNFQWIIIIPPVVLITLFLILYRNKLSSLYQLLTKKSL